MDALFDEVTNRLKEINHLERRIQALPRLATDEDRVKVVLDILVELNIQFSLDSDEKNAEDSAQILLEANDLYNSEIQRGEKLNLDRIIELCTMSVAYAPANSRELAESYGYRSLALFEAGLYRDCIDDIDRALQIDCPAQLRAQLDPRKNRCLNILDPTHPDDGSPGRKEFIKIDGRRNLPPIPDDNPEIPGASSAIKLVHSQKWGKHIVATRDINPGEILAVQKGYTETLFPDNFYSHCTYCLKQTWSGVPCNHCVNAIYCSNNCLQEAWNSYHDIECLIVNPMIKVGMHNKGLMSLRLFVKAFKEAGNLITMKNNLAEIDLLQDPRTHGFTGPILDITRYASVYTLERNTEKRSVLDLLNRGIHSCYIAYALAKRSTFFGQILPGDLGDLKNDQWFTFVAGLILRHQQIVPTNVHMKYGEFNQLLPHEEGATLVPFLSLFNHSCYPSIYIVNYGNYTAAIAYRSIKMNEQLFDNYGQHYVQRSCVVERGEFLSEKFFFHCECDVCSDENYEQNGPMPIHSFGFTQQVNQEISDQLKNLNTYHGMYINYDNKYTDDQARLDFIVDDLTNMSKVVESLLPIYRCSEGHLICQAWEKVHSLRGNRWQSLNS